jgi:hypothetical protein
VTSWVLARIIVVASLALAAYLNRQGALQPGGTRPFHATGLLGWDAAYYRDIAAHGYGALPAEARRFFPLLPLLVRVIGFGTAAGPVLLVVVNLLALAYGFVLVRLVRVEAWSEEVGSRTVWLLAIAPPAFVLVMGYTEALAGVLSVLVFLGLRSGRFGWAAAAGLLVGLCRPTGLLLAAPALIEAVRNRQLALLPRIAAVLAPLVGVGLYFCYIGLRFGDALQPLRIQQDARLHGPAGNPFHPLVDAAKGLLHGHVGTALHLPWLIVLLGLVALMARRLPASYTTWAALTVASALAGTNVDSIERYGWSAFPFVLVAALVIGTRRRWWHVLLVAGGALLAGYSLLAFLGLSVP